MAICLKRRSQRLQFYWASLHGIGVANREAPVLPAGETETPMKKHKRNSQPGFTTLQLLITIAIAAIVGAFAFIGIVKARDHMRLTSSARKFGALAEQARADSVRRHAGIGHQAGIAVVNETTYAVTMDFNDDGTETTQNFTTENGVTLSSNHPEFIFDWRGRIFVETTVNFTNSTGEYSVNISGSGDVTFDTDIFEDGSIPTPP